MFNLGKFGMTVELDTSQFDSGMTGVESKTKKASTGLGGFAKSVGKIASGLGVFALVSKGIDMVKNSLDGAIDRYDTLNNFPKVMEQIGFDAETSQAAIDKLSDGIQGLPTRLDEVADTAQSIAVMTGDLDGAVDTTLALNNAFIASGASTADAERGMQQYTQMLSKGEVDLQSWRTLQETMPYALRETAEAFGYTGDSATNDFYEALKSGDHTMDDFNEKLIELDTAQGGFAETAQEAAGGIKTAWTNMQTWVVMGVAKILESLDKAFGGVGTIEGLINGLKPIFDATFSGIATVIEKAGEAVRSIKDKFLEFKDSISPITDAMQPLISIFQETFTNVITGFMPIWESLKTLFSSLMPIIQNLAMLIGTVLLSAIIAGTTVWNGLYNAILPIINAFINLVDVVVNVVNAIIAVLTGDFDAAMQYWIDATESSIEFFKSLWDGIVGFFKGIIDAIIGWFEFLYEVLVGNSIIPDMVEAIIEWFHNMFDWLIEIVSGIVDFVIEKFNMMKDISQQIFDAFLEIITSIWEYIKDTFSNALDFLVALVTGDFEGMKDVMQNQMTAAQDLLSGIWEAIKGLIGEKASSILTNIIDKFTEIKDNMQEKIESAKTAVVDKFSEMVTSVTDKASEIVGNVQDKFNEIKQKITEPIKSAKDIIAGYIDDIKGFFSNLELKIPDIKPPKMPKLPAMPNFNSVLGSAKSVANSAMKANWNAEGGVFKRPTLFNTKNAGLQGVGEAGAEAIIPLRSKVLADIGKGISKTMNNAPQNNDNRSTYNISLKVDNMNGTKQDAKVVLKEIVEGVKRRGGKI